MASAREIKKRIRSVKNIGQITRALEAVSASRVRRAQARVLASRAYAEKAWEILVNVQNMSQTGAPLHPLLARRDNVQKILVILITSERGLAGAFNTNIIRTALRFSSRVGKPVEFITVGRKGRDTLLRAREKIIAEFTLPAEPTIHDISPIARLAIDEFLSGRTDDVLIAYTDFINMITQRPVVLDWLPLQPMHIEDMVASEYLKPAPAVTTGNLVYEYEPDPAAIIDEIVPAFTELQLYQAVLESTASEHSARMVAMRNASDNAAQLTSDLTLVYNKARQAAITNEILDIVGGAEALQASLDKMADDILLQYQHEMLQRPQMTEVKPAWSPVGQRVGAADNLGRVEVVEAVVDVVGVMDAPADASADAPDDLTVIEGIGPKMSAALIAAGINTYAKLAAADEGRLRAAIEAAGMRFSPSLPTWSRQAAYAASGDFDGLRTYQSELSGGRPS